ncbi:MAG: cyclomaltodextrinase, partial [Elusimicrobiota bacterium]|nr:cyclomaltodextrinase [Elusimicrobiota bacterium]
MKWFEKAVFYQIYTFGFCGAPLDNDNIEKNRIKKVIDWIQHFKNTGIDAIYFCPIFDSDRHGYDIRDYRKVDCRIGTNEEFKEVCNKLKENNISIVLDAVFNHTGKQFWAFQDVKINRENSKYKDWFYIDFSRNSADNLGFYYEGWEGHFELVKLNLKNPEVKAYLIDSVKMWMHEFNIDGLRLDVAYMLDTDFMIDLRKAVKSIREDFFLLGETIHGDYNKIVNDKMLDSSTNYQAYKGLFSSFNDKNFFEIAYTLNIHFGQNGSYKGKHLFSFADNHDVNRLASVLKDKNHLPLVYAILFSMPGIPCIYYGS